MSVRNDLVKVEENEYFDRKTRKFALTNAPWIHMCVRLMDDTVITCTLRRTADQLIKITKRKVS